MKVKTRLQISAALPVLLAVITAFILYRISVHVKDVVPKLVAANGIAHEAARLDQATFMFMLSPDEAAREEWIDAHKSLNSFLTLQPSLSDRDSVMLKDLQQQHQETTAIFTALSAHLASLGKTDVVANDLVARELLGQILKRTRTTVAGAQTLAANAHDNAVYLQEIAYLGIISVATILAGVLAMLALILITRVTGGIDGLKAGMTAIGADNVAYRMSPDGADEITELAKGFNRMAEEIGTARQRLKDEIAEKEKVAQSLRRSNIELSTAMEKLQRAQNDVLHRERSDALRQIARGIVHDINDALMPVKGLSDLYVNYPDQLKDTKEVQEAFVSVHAASERISKVVQNIASFCAPAKKQGKTRIDLGAVVKEVVSATEPMWKAQKQIEGVAIVVKTELGPVPEFDADKSDLVDAIRALLTNAVEAMPSGGSVTIKTQIVGKDAVVEVSDTGEGMDHTLRTRALEPFFSAKGEGHSGMGLTSVQGAVARAAGTFRLESAPGKGTTASMTIPIGMGSTAAKPAPTAPTLARKLKILTVDDELWSSKVLSRHLTVDGHHTDSCATGQAALAMVRDRKFDLVIVDRAMPDMSGDALAQEIKTIQPKVPVLMLTGFGGLMANDVSLPKGVDRVLSKPVDIKELRDALAAVISATA